MNNVHFSVDKWFYGGRGRGAGWVESRIDVDIPCAMVNSATDVQTHRDTF